MKIYMTLVTILTLSLTSFNDFNYDKAWKKVEKHIKDGLPKSALKQVDEIYDAAKQDNNDIQQIKATNFRTSLILNTEELGLETVIGQLEERIQQSNVPVKNILQSINAELIANYFNQNYYRIQKRTDLDQPTDDIRTWSPNNYRSYIGNLYLESLSGDIKDIPSSKYKELISNEKMADLSLRPTLYGLLIDRAMNYFSQGYVHQDKGIDRFLLNDKGYLSMYQDFEKLSIDTENENSFNYRLLRLYQDALAYGINLDDENVISSYDINRLSHVYSQSNILHKDSLYLNALNKSEQLFTTGVAKERYGIAIVNHLRAKGETAKALDKIAEVSRYATKWGKAQLKNTKNQIMQPEVNISSRQVYTSDDDLIFQVNSKNVKRLDFKIVKLEHELIQTINNYDVLKGIISKRKSLVSWSTDVNSSYDFDKRLITTKALPYGYYGLVTTNDAGMYSLNTFWVSDIAYSVFSAENSNEVVVVNRSNGKPMANAKVDFYSFNYNGRSRVKIPNKSEISDQNGKVNGVSSDSRSMMFTVSKGKDYLDLNSNIYYNNYRTPRAKRYVEIFTDRSIYRPGQTIHFKGIVLHMDNDHIPSLITEGNVNVELYDANHQKVHNIDLTINEFGSFSGTFILPKGQLTGNFRLSISGANGLYGNHGFSVEEYKRPTFKVVVEDNENTYGLGDKVSVNGEAKYYSGASVSNAEGSYRIYRSRYQDYWRYYFRPQMDKVMIHEGTFSTDDQGRFVIDFLADTDGVVGMHQFDIEIDITDGNGETRSTSHNMSISDQPYQYTIQGLKDHDSDEEIKPIVYAKNMQGVSVTSKAKIEIYKADFNEDLYALFKGQNEEEQAEPTFKLLNSFEVEIDTVGYPLDLSKLKGGNYKITVTSVEKYKGEPVVAESMVAITDFDKGIFPDHQLVYVKGVDEEYKVGEPISLTLGTSDEPVVMHYRWINKNKVLKEDWITLSNKKTISYTPNISDKGGITFQYYIVKNNTQFQGSHQIKIPWTDKFLAVRLETLRDKTMPGSEEEWKLLVEAPDGEVIQGEVLASMYDASLDQFRPHSWSFAPFPNQYGYLRPQLYGFYVEYDRQLDYRWNQFDYDQVDQKQVPQLLGLPSYYYAGRDLMVRGSRMESSGYFVDGVKSAPMVMRSKSADHSEEMMMDEVQIVQDESANAAVKEYTKKTASAKSKYEGENVDIRENLDETVFFYPHIKLNDQDEAKIAFKMNEAMTTWKFMALVHDKEVKYGMTTHQIKTQKEVMIQPNSTRFMRQGDVIYFPATVFNLTDKEMDVDVHIELSDAIDSDRDLMDVFGEVERKKVHLEAGASKVVTWQIKVPSDFSQLVKYKVWAKSALHSDGQAGYLPILTNSKLLTESKIVSLRSGESQRISLDGMGDSDTARPYAVTVEYTSNPVWYAVQALPYLCDHNNRDIISIVNKYYANALAAHIAKSHPRIKQVVNQWNLNDSDALLSNLEKNEELKYAVLNETPWVMAARTETDQKRRIKELFNDNNLNNAAIYVKNELITRQNADGGYSWYPGGESSVHTTQYILKQIGHLNKLGIDKYGNLNQMIERAVRYIDRASEKRYEDLKESIARYGGKLSDDHLDRTSINYLYTRRFFNNPIDQGHQEAYDYYFEQAKKYWLGKGLQCESMIGMVLHDKEDVKYNDIARSLEERSFYSDDLGRYWNQGNGYHWYDLPIETHAMLIEFFNDIKAEGKFIEDAKIWLLKNKQTNHWSTGSGTAYAIYALLVDHGRSGSDSWLGETAMPDIMIDGQRLSIDRLEEGTGYFKRTFAGDELKSMKFSDIKFKNSGKTISWGAVYYQYIEELDHVKQHRDNPLNIRRTLYKEVTDRTSGTKLEEITDGYELKPGDKVITRIEIKSDRSMDYVHLKDMRASGFEPENVLSGYRWNPGFGYYESTRDLASHFFISHLPKGTHVFEYPSRVVHKGNYSGGIATIQNMYAPEFTSHSEGIRVIVKSEEQ